MVVRQWVFRQTICRFRFFAPWRRGYSGIFSGPGTLGAAPSGCGILQIMNSPLGAADSGFPAGSLLGMRALTRWGRTAPAYLRFCPGSIHTAGSAHCPDTDAGFSRERIGRFFPRSLPFHAIFFTGNCARDSLAPRERAALIQISTLQTGANPL